MPGLVKKSIFISYRRADSPDTVKLVFERLKNELPRWEIFYDHKSITPGEAFPERLRKEVTSADVVLVIIGPSWLKIVQEREGQSGVDHVREEVRLAINSGHTVIPVPVANAKNLSGADLVEFPDIHGLASLNARPIRPEPDFDNDINRLMSYLELIGPGEGIGTILDGKYKIISELGVGGMGIVYAAEQLDPRRTIAVKLIKPGMDSREVLARFEAERQALGVMDHPNIAKVLDAGTAASGRPYFAMEYVKGIPITEYCDQHKLSPADRLPLFKQVCGAVQHAHQKGIIHRDIKPTNVLVETVEGKAVPKVIDFGLAKALGYKLTDKTLMTTFETRLGTLEYSSPEQSAGKTLEIDTRTDIYSLGALLYELLAGAPPFSREELMAVGDEEMQRVIRENDPPRPSAKLSSSNLLPTIAANRHLEPGKLTGLVRGDLDWIVMKALEKEPRRRYETANSLANDIDHYLAHEPIEARPPSSRYILGKFIRRNRGAVVSGTAIFVALLAGLTGSGLGLNWALIERGRARQNEKRAIENETLAREQSELALKSLESVIVDIQAKLKNVAGGTQLRRKLLQTALERLQEVSDKYTSRATIDRNTMLARADLADVFMRIGTETKGSPLSDGPLKSAQKLYQQAFEIAEKLVAADPINSVVQRDLSNIYDKLGDVQFQFGKLTEALGYYQKGFEIRQTLAAANPGSSEIGRSLFISLENIATVQLQSGHLTQAMETYRQSEEITQKLAAANPNDAQCQRDLAFSYSCLGRLQLQSGELTEAKETFQKALAIDKSLTTADPSDSRDQRNMSVNYDCLGLVQIRFGNLTEAMRSFRMALDIRQKLAATDPSDARAQRDLCSSHDYLGFMQLRFGELDEAMGSYRRAHDIRQKLAATDPSDPQAQGDLSISYDNLGAVQIRSGELTEAKGSYQKALEIRQILAATDSSNSLAQQALSRSYIGLGDVQLSSGELSEAMESFQKSLEIAQKLATTDPNDSDAQVDLSRSYTKLGMAQLRSRELTEAMGSYQKSLEISQALATTDPDDYGAQHNLWISYYDLGSAAQAGKEFQLAIRCFENAQAIMKTAQDRGQLATQDTAFLIEIDRLILRCKISGTALGDWNTVLEQPADLLPELLTIRGYELVNLGRIPEAIQAIEKLRELGTATAGQLYSGACVFSLSATGIKTEDPEITEEQSERRKQYIVEALATLREAVAAGWNDFAHMKSDPDLAPLRDLPEFQALFPSDARSK